MASLPEAEIQRLLARALPLVHLLNVDEEGAMVRRALSYLVRGRSGGFMAVLPDEALVTDCLDCLGADGHAPLSLATEVEGESRGRALGPMRALLVDFSFEQGVLFRKPNTRGLVPGQLVAFAVDGSPARPTAASAAAAADRWITETMDEDTAQDYVTGDSADEAELLAADTPQGLPAGSPAQDNVLAKRVAELEALVRQQQQALQAGQASVAPAQRRV